MYVCIFNQNRNNEKKICCDRKHTNCFQNLKLTSKGQEKLFGVMEMVCSFIMEVVMWMNILVKIHQRVHLK